MREVLLYLILPVGIIVGVVVGGVILFKKKVVPHEYHYHFRHIPDGLPRVRTDYSNAPIYAVGDTVDLSFFGHTSDYRVEKIDTL